jgi:SAM-dependent methyltransferase
MSLTDALCRRREGCRLCGGTGLRKVLSLAPIPLANAFLTREELDSVQPRFPLDAWLCESCGHVQLLDVIDSRVLFEHYVYVSGTSPTFVHHFEQYADYVLGRFALPAKAFVVEIGSNDGTLLKFFRDRGRRVLGVDPALEISEATRRLGIPTITGFFTPGLAESILAEHGHAEVIAANNVLAHIDDLDSVMRGVARLLAPSGVLVFEVAYLADLVEKILFDTIYHEHIDYHSVGPLIPFLARHGLQLIEAIRVDTHGGSVRCVAQRKGGPFPVGASVSAALRLEEEMGLKRPETYVAFASKIEKLGKELVTLLRTLAAQGKRIAGFGAPAKATTLMYHLGITPEMIEFIVDDSPLKQGRFSPGMHIPVLPARAIYERRPDYLLILAWNFARPIIEKHAAFAKAGGRFIVPLPSLEVI